MNRGPLNSRRHGSRLRSGLAACATMASVAFGGAASADDTEIFFTSSDATIHANVMIVVDTSASMNSTGNYGAPYDPAQTYVGPCTDPTKVFRAISSPPECTEDKWIQLSSLKCQAALTQFATAGLYVDRLQEWRSSSGGVWQNLTVNRPRDVECSADDGVHGAATGGAAVYAAMGVNGGPWSSDSSKRIDWNAASTYTLYSTNYLNWYHTIGNVSQQRMDVVRAVLISLLGSVGSVNVGLMQFSTDSDGGMVIHPVVDIDVAANRASLIAAATLIDAPPDSAATPLTEALVEAYRYFKGDNVHYGLDSLAFVTASGLRVVTPSVTSSRMPLDQSRYKSPLIASCQRCVILLLTDGVPEGDSNADTMINALPGFTALSGSCSYNAGNDCLDEFSKYIHKTDYRADIPGTQVLQTFTVGFEVDDPLLLAAATNGGGKYYTVDNTAELATALTSIVAQVIDVNSSFTAPSLTVNAYNRTQHSDELYMTAFKPLTGPAWIGNLKKYQLGIDGGGALRIEDANGDAAVDPDTGYFFDSAVSFWTDGANSPDGQAAGKGGAANELVASRRVSTWLGASDSLASSTNDVRISNLLLTDAVMGASSNAERESFIEWLRGIDVDDEDDDGDVTEARLHMGDPLHSRPVVVNYDAQSPENSTVVFVGTNEGILHAFHTDDGSEALAFVPRELLANAGLLKSGIGTKLYGVDGQLTAQVRDQDKDGVIEPADGDEVTVITSLGRGGRDYYALDVSDLIDAKLKWRIVGGAGAFMELGQSWSRAVPGKIRMNGSVVEVLIFSGGYDDAQDVPGTTNDDLGRAVYIVNAATGARIWWAGPAGSGADLELADMTNSIPAEPTVIDVNGDAIADILYAADLGGRVWRFDLDRDATSASNLARGGAIANFGLGGTTGQPVAGNRRFYNPPDASLLSLPSGDVVISVSVGSGYRGHPNDTQIDDMFFSFRDPFLATAPPSYAYGITTATLYDATVDVFDGGSEAQQSAALEQILDPAIDGWYMRLGLGEKVLARATTFNGVVMFTTFTPSSVAAQAQVCGADAGLGKLYVVHQLNAAKSSRLTIDIPSDVPGDTASATRAVELSHSGIPPEVAVVFAAATEGQPQALVGPEHAPVDLSGSRVKKTYWYERSQ